MTVKCCIFPSLSVWHTVHVTLWPQWRQWAKRGRDIITAENKEIKEQAGSSGPCLLPWKASTLNRTSASCSLLGGRVATDAQPDPQDAATFCNVFWISRKLWTTMFQVSFQTAGDWFLLLIMLGAEAFPFFSSFKSSLNARVVLNSCFR